MKQVLVFLILALITLKCFALNRFIVDIYEVNQPKLSLNTPICTGTIITERHVLTTASCVVADPPKTIRLELVVATFIPEGSINTTHFFHARRIYVHRDYQHGRNMIANIAVIQTEFRFPPASIAPRLLGTLQVNRACNLFGWRGALADPRRDAVLIQGSQSCDPDFPQALCSNFLSNALTSCDAFQGATVVCDDGRVDGFLLNNQECLVNGDIHRLNYHSVGEFLEWIETIINEITTSTTVPITTPTDAGMTASVSVALIISAALINLSNLQ